MNDRERLIGVRHAAVIGRYRAFVRFLTMATTKRPHSDSRGFDSNSLSRILTTVIRLFLAALCALGLAFGPVATSGATAAQSMPGCTMDGHMPAKPANHSKRDCCTATCPLTAAALPVRMAEAAPLKSNGAPHGPARARELLSYTASGLDPPPRLPS